MSTSTVEPSGLEARWHGLLGRQGVLDESGCGLLFEVSRRGQSGSATVREVTSELVTFTIVRDQKTFERVVPLGQLIYELPR